MGDINVNNLRTVANEIVRALDCADNNEDKKISASIWNDFVADKGGKRIQNDITLGNALKSVMTYMRRMAEKTGETVDEISSKWAKEVSLYSKDETPPVDDTTPPAKDENPPVDDTTPPAKDENPPVDDTNHPAIDDKEKSVRVKKIIKSKYKGTYGYTDKDCKSICEVRDDNGNIIRILYLTEDGTVNFYDDYEYDQNGNEIRRIQRNPDGTVMEYDDYEYDQNGNEIRSISRNPDGTVREYDDYEYDQNGNEIRSISRNPDGTVSGYTDYEYDQNGNQIRI